MLICIRLARLEIKSNGVKRSTRHPRKEVTASLTISLIHSEFQVTKPIFTVTNESTASRRQRVRLHLRRDDKRVQFGRQPLLVPQTLSLDCQKEQ